MMRELTFEEVQIIEEVYNYEKPHKELYHVSKGMVEMGIIDATLAKLLNDEMNNYQISKSKLRPIGVYVDKTNFKTEYYESNGMLYQYGYVDDEIRAIIICKKKVFKDATVS